MKLYSFITPLLILSSLSSCVAMTSPTSSPSSSSVDENVIRTDGSVTAEDGFFDLFDDSRFHRIVIKVSSSQLREMDTAMNQQHATFGHYKTSTYYKAAFDYYEDEELKKSYTQIGIRIHGNIFSRLPIEYREDTVNPVHFRLSFDETFTMTPGSEEYEERRKRDLYSLENLILKWNRTSLGTPYAIDPYITEEYAFEMFESAGIIAPRAALTQLDLEIDGNVLPLGVYTMLEPVDENFIEKRFSPTEREGNLYKALWQNGQATLTDTSDYLFGIKNEEENYFPAYDIKTNEDTNDASDLKNFIATYQTLTGDDLYDYLMETMDLDQWFRFQAMDYLLGNPDNFRYDVNNYYLYFSSGSHPKMYWIPTDYDKALGIQDWNPDGTLMTGVLPFSSFVSQEWVTTPPLIANTLLSGESRYAVPYTTYLNEFASSLFTYDQWLNEYVEAETLYRDQTNHAEGQRWQPRPMGKPSAIQQWFCIQRYKAQHPYLVSLEGVCPTA